MSEQRMEVLKLQLQEEVEDPFRAKLHAAEAEVSIVKPLQSHVFSRPHMWFREAIGGLRDPVPLYHGIGNPCPQTNTPPMLHPDTVIKPDTIGD